MSHSSASHPNNDALLLAMRQELDCREETLLSPLACRSRAALRRRPESAGYRQEFAMDADRILHSRAYTRYIDKTQVFSLIKNDHITHRVLHVQLVSKIARTVGRFLRLNEDLIEAIALAHDIGHPPFGHDGEEILSKLCVREGLPPFLHNVQSVLFLDSIEKRGQGWNLTLQTLDGILCHDGEVHDVSLAPEAGRTFESFAKAIAEKQANPKARLAPMTLEGCLMRFCDTVAYIGRDIEDAIELKLINRTDLPASCRAVLGDTNGTIVYRLVTDLIATSRDKNAIGFSPEVSEALRTLKRFNYDHIYCNPAIKRHLPSIRAAYKGLFGHYLDLLAKKDRMSPMHVEFLDQKNDAYIAANPPAARVRDFIAGMTDEYFLAQAKKLGYWRLV